jgi:hypothetical protein
MSLRELNIKVTLRDEASRPLRDIDKEVDKTKNGFEKMAQSVAALGFGAIMSGFAKSAVETYGKFEKYETVLRTTFTNSGEAAKAGMDVVKFSTMKATEAMEQIKTFAANTPYAVDELTGSFIKLANRGMTPSMETMTAFGDVAASQGKSFDQFTEAVLDATGGEFERMKEFGIKAHKMGNQVELSFKGVNQKIANTPEAIQAAIIGFGQLEGVMGGMDAVSNTFMGRINNMGDSFDAIKVKVGTFLAFVSAPLLNFYTDKSAGFDRLKFTLMALIPVIGFLTVVSFGAMLSTVYAMISGITVLGVSFMAWMGWAVAIGVAVTAIYLVLEDLFIFAKYGIDGSDTVFGKWLVSMKVAPETINKIRENLSVFFNFFIDSFEKLGTAIFIALEFVEDMFDGITRAMDWMREHTRLLTAIAIPLLALFTPLLLEMAAAAFANGVVMAASFLSASIQAGIAFVVMQAGYIKTAAVSTWAGIKMAAAWLMALGPIGWIGLAIGALVGLIYYYWDEIAAGWDWLLNYLTENAETIGKILITLLFPIAGIWLFRDEIMTFLNWLLDWVVEKFGKVFSFMAELFGKPKVLNVTENVDRNISERNVPATGESTVNGISEFFGLEKRARGGPVAEGQSVIVGDGGEPEVFTAGASGFVTPVSKMTEGASSSGSKPITITLSFNGDMNFTGANGKENAMQFSEKLSEILDSLAPTLAAKMGVA